MANDKNNLPYVLSDLDGTISLMDFSFLKTTLTDIASYQKASGNKFSFITGRNMVVNKAVIEQLKIKLPIVSCNGALITDHKGEVLAAEYLDKRTCVTIFREADNFDLDLICYTPTAIVGTADSNRIKAWNAYNQKQKPSHKFEITIFPDLDAIADAIADESIKPLELVCVVENDEERKAMQAIFDSYQDEINYVQSDAMLFDALKKGINKEFGLKKWAELINTDPQQVVCFGDNYNDLEMIKLVEHGYVVDNGVQALKDLAYKVIKSVDENGVGEQLERIIKHEYD
ncbi:Pyridoxal phosphate phosphatase YigL [Mesoplasma sp. JKS002658]|uniref:Cof-type HAD-IIB family hydrolase n=1 Tax=Mesoplasma whartonense TaxID=2878854 RepID=UPI0020229E72|nr:MULTISPECIES: Cof-type HAD-IIB family hydrolase [unclassified Mesoplasma]MCL8211226.1 Pyridoxal phosphate phosphatase YigL [Mesoplasma sp. JKS002664]MCL8211887.1 Pyridoxal phosphate phosphatase YigL [Mesoplasma sp. JKS002662]MCL8213129.1 Pyridoxal phosphate phosphatase YigL [Mesoplasma sp. JKS002660]MCL8214008.1 Pyridoxal phosphate phosphatase YigL [Mesoplasma sp. JKS002658]MCL8214564.1 Pyridoxal phosphate phosphatase YigL [Mesoplasma sp. JKS002663]